ncbi:MAG TPA: chemotaxis protein CheW [Thermoanaerobaculia bacterium]|nr:chemotaxis protein CheW [Thermoanaerobaculia bacterium]
MNELHELIDAFRSETEEIFERVGELLLQLEQWPDDTEALNEIFRGAHTIKGGAACLQFDELTALAHEVEEELEELRNGAARPTRVTISRLLESFDAMRALAARSISGSALSRSTSHSLRVGIDRLDDMLDLTGEIAIARGRVRELCGGDDRALDAMRELDRLCFDLQELVMRARMVALAPALRPFQRVVRDVAALRGKEVSLVIEAGDVEVDSAVIEQLRDPITHMLRNAIDHGIESIGTIRITASHDRSGITICLSDDGRGLDEEKIARRAQELGLEPSLDLIFRPGFSTASEVTDLSGRGVGMDVVRRNVDALRGTISVASRRGAGTTFTIRLPLTVSVIEGFAVAAAGETYVLPIDVVAECMALPATAANDATGILNVRGEVLPFLRLREVFALSAVQRPHRENVVVVQHDHGRAALVVDDLLGASDTVMKPIGGLLGQVPGVSGSSILGNGRVALVLDARELVRCAIQTQSATR